MQMQTVLVVDFGAQYTQLIARRVREAGVYSEIVPHTITPTEIAERQPAGIILSGGPASVNKRGAPKLDSGIYKLGLPMLGICYGAQLLARKLGAKVVRSKAGEYGPAKLLITSRGLLVNPRWSAVLDIWMSHGDIITSLPERVKNVACTDKAEVAIFEDQVRKWYGTQFHPEVVHTQYGQKMLQRFLYQACGCKKHWKSGSIIRKEVEAIRDQVGNAPVICGLSGGVDSAVAAALTREAVGANLTCVYVDTGLMREGESDQVVEAFGRSQNTTLIHVEAAAGFFRALKGVTDPEEKRKVIGERFIREFEAAARSVQDAKFLVQGTLYPDVVESGGGQTSRIKSHHNVGGLPEDMDFDLVEPLRTLFKDEVRKIGRKLGLPDEIVDRHPFPGPGLAIRIIGEVTRRRAKLLRRADTILREEIKAAGLDKEIWQVFAVLLADIRSVGVMGDERTYGHPIVIRAVTSEDAMTADVAEIPTEVMSKIVTRITSEVKGINRVTYDVTPKPPGTIEWE
jgi:GMP synthase (glutamine-hydrolysing)